MKGGVKMKSRVLIGICCMALTCVLLTTERGLCKTWYVEKIASDGGNGESWSGAWNSFSKINWGSIQPGDRIEVGGGVYNEEFEIYKSGVEGSVIEIVASQEEGHNAPVVISGASINLKRNSYLVLDGFEIMGSTDRAGIYGGGTSTSRVRFVTIRNCYIHDMFNSGMYLLWSYDCVIQNCRIERITTNNDGISMNGDNNVIEYCTFKDIYQDQVEGFANTETLGVGNIIRYNDFSNPTPMDRGTEHPDLLVSGGTMEVYGNYFHEHPSQGVWIELSREGSVKNIFNNVFYRVATAINMKLSPVPNIYNNTFVECPAQVLRIQSTMTGTGKIVNNLFYDNTPTPRVENPSNISEWHHNAYYRAGSAMVVSWGDFGELTVEEFRDRTGFGSGDVVLGTDPFVSKSGRDFRLPFDSSAKALGVPIGHFSIDKAKKERPTTGWSVGAYEPEAGEMERPQAPRNLNIGS